MLKALVLLIVLVLFMVTGQCNDDICILKGIENQLERDTSISDYFIKKKHYRNGNAKWAIVFLKYKHDTIEPSSF